jgi:hypothetical protein
MTREKWKNKQGRGENKSRKVKQVLKGELV